jgi:hypothetical protein
MASRDASLDTLHGPSGQRLVGFDNAHAVAGQRQGGAKDHQHRLRTVKAFDYTDAAALLSAFWLAVDAVMQDLGD